MLFIPFSLAPRAYNAYTRCHPLAVQTPPFGRASLSGQLSYEFITYYRTCPRLLLTKQQVQSELLASNTVEQSLTRLTCHSHASSINIIFLIPCKRRILLMKTSITMIVTIGNKIL